MEPNEQNRCVRLGQPLNGFMSIGGDTIRLTAFGKTYHFEWHNYCGPMFVAPKTGRELKRPPGTKSPWWKAFSLWDRQGKRTKDGECVWTPGETCSECGGKGHVPGKGKLTGFRSPCHTCVGEGVVHSVPTEPWNRW